MPDVTLVRRPIAPGKADLLREWYSELETRLDEVVETLQHEGVYTETAFIQDAGDRQYLVGYLEAADVEAALAAGDEEAYEIDEQHHAVLDEALEGEWEELELLGHFTNPERA